MLGGSGIQSRIRASWLIKAGRYHDNEFELYHKEMERELDWCIGILDAARTLDADTNSRLGARVGVGFGLAGLTFFG